MARTINIANEIDLLTSATFPCSQAGWDRPFGKTLWGRSPSKSLESSDRDAMSFKPKLYRMLARRVALCGSECWPVTKEADRRLSVMDNKMFLSGIARANGIRNDDTATSWHRSHSVQDAWGSSNHKMAQSRSAGNREVRCEKHRRSVSLM